MGFGLVIGFIGLLKLMTSNYNCFTKVKVEIMLHLMISWPVYLGVKSHLGPKTRFLLLSNSCGFVDVGCPLCQDDRSVIYNCCWLCQHSDFWVWVLRDSWPYFTVSDLRFPQPEGPGPRLYPPGTGWLSYTPKQWVPFSSPPMTRMVTVEVFTPASTGMASSIVACTYPLPRRCVHRVTA
jgi:hypothetical protein